MWAAVFLPFALPMTTPSFKRLSFLALALNDALALSASVTLSLLAGLLAVITSLRPERVADFSLGPFRPTATLRLPCTRLVTTVRPFGSEIVSERSFAFFPAMAVNESVGLPVVRPVSLAPVSFG